MRLSADVFSSIISSLRSDKAVPSPKERRADPRVGLWAKLRIIRTDGAGTAGLEVHVRDLSPSGMCLSAAVPLAVGTFFVAHLPGEDRQPLAVAYQVRHCRKLDAGAYKIGAQLQRILDAKAGTSDPVDSQAA